MNQDVERYVTHLLALAVKCCALGEEWLWECGFTEAPNADVAEERDPSWYPLCPRAVEGPWVAGLLAM